MNIKLLDSTEDIGEAFINRFVMSWEKLQVELKDWIAEMEKKNYSIDIAWYEQSYMWDRMGKTFPRVSMEAAIMFLKEHSGSVFFMSEKGEDIYYRGKKCINEMVCCVYS